VSRELYVVLDGSVAISVDGTHRGVLGEGDFFGGIAAIEWGAGFARTRTPTVTATVPTRLLVLDWTLVDELMKTEPTFRDRLAKV
jgi:CRP-like cAMP-binding protein